MLVYLVHNANTPFDSRVLEVNDAAPHGASCQAFERALLWPRAVIDRVRQQVAVLVNAHPGRVIFMNDGTQPGNFAIKGVVVLTA